MRPWSAAWSVPVALQNLPTLPVTRLLCALCMLWCCMQAAQGTPPCIMQPGLATPRPCSCCCATVSADCTYTGVSPAGAHASLLKVVRHAVLVLRRAAPVFYSPGQVLLPWAQAQSWRKPQGCKPVAAADQCPLLLCWLRRAGAAVDALTRSGRASALHRAAHTGHLEVVNLL